MDSEKINLYKYQNNTTTSKKPMDSFDPSQNAVANDETTYSTPTTERQMFVVPVHPTLLRHSPNFLRTRERIIDYHARVCGQWSMGAASLGSRPNSNPAIKLTSPVCSVRGMFDTRVASTEPHHQTTSLEEVVCPDEAPKGQSPHPAPDGWVDPVGRPFHPNLLGGDCFC
jgi:hypothetical protein